MWVAVPKRIQTTMKTTKAAAEVRRVRPNVTISNRYLTQDILSEVEIWKDPINLDTKAHKKQERTLKGKPLIYVLRYTAIL